MAPIVKECMKRGCDYFIIHTGQHYSYDMDRIFFGDLDLPEPKYDLQVGSGSHAEQTARLLTRIEDVLLSENPDILLVEGDTNTVLGGALAAAKIHIAIGHVEAGLRSYDRKMPEELNRILTDHLSDLLFAPTGKSKNILLREGIPEEKIFVTGNTIVDALQANLKIAKNKVSFSERLGLLPKSYLVLTIHRPENVENVQRLQNIFLAIQRIQKELRFPIIFPVHPRTRQRIQENGTQIPIATYLTDPMGYLEFLKLEANARLVLTDSGGIQEETCILKVPCVTLRESTERPETVEVGSNLVVGTNPDRVFDGTLAMLHGRDSWINPFGDGKTGTRIVDIIESRLRT